VTVDAPPRPVRADERSLDERVAELEALIEEARQRARRRRRRNGVLAMLAILVGVGLYFGFVRTVPHEASAAATSSKTPLDSGRSSVRNGPITLFLAPSIRGLATIESVGNGTTRVFWQCPRRKWCGQPVSFAWSADGKRVAFTLDEIGGNSSYVGMHVVNVVTGKDTQIPAGAPPLLSARYRKAEEAYLRRMGARVGCWPATDLAWSPDGSSLAYRCGPNRYGDTVGANAHLGPAHINVLDLKGSGYRTIPIPTTAYWPSWSPAGTRIAYATALIRPTENTRIYTVALDGSHRRLVTTGGAAPAWSPDGQTIAYQTRCGIRLVTPTGANVTPQATANWCGAIGLSGPPAWSPDGKQLAVETKHGVYVMNADGSHLHQLSPQQTSTWYGALPGRPAWRSLPD
jgi:dipeptidyl aminopeptidase/acylaminoacyl peptidase